MATFSNRKGRITAQIRKVTFDGRKLSVSKTFASLEEAKYWADNWEDVERRMDRHDKFIVSKLDVLKQKRHPANHALCGVYFLFLGRHCVYVGQSTNIFVRIRDHQLPRSGRKEFDSFTYIEVPPASLNAVEAYYITMFSPSLNTSMNPILKSTSPRDTKCYEDATFSDQ
jgi:hypothetical protein